MRLVVLAAVCVCALVAADAPRPLYRIETVAGSANLGDGGPATAAQFGAIQGIALDRWGNLYVADTDRHRVRKINTAGIVSTLAGTGVPGFSGDGAPAPAAQLNLPYGLAADLAGYVYIADLGNHRIRRVSPDGTITTIAGNGRKASGPDGGQAVETPLLTPRNVAVDAAGYLYISEFEGHRVRRVAPDGKIWTVAGTGIAGFRGDGGPAATAQLG
jgi:sugar lactone lactonase YvrE